MAKAWYFFIGGDVLSTESYHKVETHTCLCGDKICSIYLPDTGKKPQIPLSDNMTNYITRALATQKLQPEKPFDTKKFVYLRD
jgi:hypothetical protein